ncbi:hypothetical protein PHYSODRAFT_288659 [Phytophthora sojae]|uniref:RxLR effector protein n=2 Tax=Phytophthora sojae TaxID=67593 RepID=G5A6L2_PHYSP|nr:hypothetical protein PHYSODRAFT_288659 [Phytophthora sojae]AEK81327.1 Avh435 [Phytophthora sojae]AEK81328.1 Avh435 [Phytophthora sojae]AEK81329.1 Avh435 [Phytophthora sojae]EGZ08967.1 hypothetical protein PHYSODRAFT_288659 [Phytophthora sojae]|eukprot:XP_009535600.1 hypothetical protein PHYSODRAFT_288659 [Phytophthora sojae]
MRFLYAFTTIFVLVFLNCGKAMGVGRSSHEKPSLVSTNHARLLRGGKLSLIPPEYNNEARALATTSNDFSRKILTEMLGDKTLKAAKFNEWAQNGFKADHIRTLVKSYQDHTKLYLQYFLLLHPQA